LRFEPPKRRPIRPGDRGGKNDGGGRKRRKSGALADGPGLAVVAAGDAGDAGALLLGIDGRRDAVERPRHEGRPAARRLVDAVRRPTSVPGVMAKDPGAAVVGSFQAGNHTAVTVVSRIVCTSRCLMNGKRKVMRYGFKNTITSVAELGT
jgi:hypothetical protein